MEPLPKEILAMGEEEEEGEKEEEEERKREKRRKKEKMSPLSSSSGFATAHSLCSGWAKINRNTDTTQSTDFRPKTDQHNSRLLYI
jgi:hypothetical protein